MHVIRGYVLHARSQHVPTLTLAKPTASFKSSIVQNAVELSLDASDAIVGFLKRKGVDDQVRPVLEKHLGDTYFYAAGDIFKEHTDKYYLEVTDNQKKIKEMFYGRGKCFFLINDDNR